MDKYKERCPICMNHGHIYESYTFPEHYFRCFCCQECNRNIEHVYNKSAWGHYNYYEDVPRKYWSYMGRVLNIAFGNEHKPERIHLSKKLYFHPNSRNEGCDPMIL
tara:strand:+ start:282 stop:599 length:318 start_codon:yes stop_codon:yes gene_type:complete